MVVWNNEIEAKGMRVDLGSTKILIRGFNLHTLKNLGNICTVFDVASNSTLLNWLLIMRNVGALNVSPISEVKLKPLTARPF